MPERPPIGNELLDALPPAERAAIEATLTLTKLEARKTVYRAHEQIEVIFFPVDCVLSVVTAMDNGDSVEICTIGREGLSGSQLTFNAHVSENETTCHIGGLAETLTARDFHRHFEQQPEFRRLVMAYVESLFNFMAQSIACNRLHNLNERCARWLLSTHDRVGRDEFALTQEFLATMLGTARPAVTATAGALQDAGFIRYHRGSLTIVDRRGLEGAACECYGVTTRSFARAMGTPD